MGPEIQHPRSCDRCHALKERCSRPLGSSQCTRCVRLRAFCQTRRPLKRAGRRPAPPSPESGTPTCPRGNAVARDQHTSPSPSRALGTLSREDLWLLDGTVANDSHLDLFVIGPSFYSRLRENLVSCYITSRPLVKDAYMACALLWTSQDAASPGGPEPNNFYRRATSAIATLSSLHLGAHEDVMPAVILGSAILTFTLKLGGAQALPVCNKVLSLLKPAYDANPASWISCDLVNGIAMAELAECLLFATVPTLLPMGPPTQTDSAHVDCYVGLCSTFLPHLYNLCQECSKRSRGDIAGTDESLDNLELAIRDWRPIVPTGIVDNLTSIEVAHLLCQAHILPTAAVLVIHRLRNPFGTEDATASALSSSILSQLNMTRLVTGRTPRCIDLSLIIACMEVEGETERRQHLEAFSPTATYSTLFQQRIEAILNATWEARQQRTDLYWHNLVHVIPPNVMHYPMSD